MALKFRRFSTAATILWFVLVASLIVVPVMAQTSIDGNRFSEIYETVSPSVVAISVNRNSQATGATLPQQQEQTATGTGFVYDTRGYIITNAHVVQDAQNIEVEFFDGTLARANIIGIDPDSDLAVIEVIDVDGEILRPVQFGDSSNLKVGETVLAIGSPFGEGWTLTSGIISALDRTIRGLTQFSIGGVIQTDAAINPGNSGGPLLNIDGAVIGVNSQIISATRSSAGIGFAIPSNLTLRVTNQLIEQGYVEYSYLGISGGNVTLDLLDAFDLPANTRGVVISGVAPGGPAARAGIQAMGSPIQSDTGQSRPGSVDIITAIDGNKIMSIEDLIGYLAQNTQPGDEIVLTVLRNGTDTIEQVARLTPRP